MRYDELVESADAAMCKVRQHDRLGSAAPTSIGRACVIQQCRITRLHDDRQALAHVQHRDRGTSRRGAVRQRVHKGRSGKPRESPAWPARWQNDPDNGREQPPGRPAFKRCHAHCSRRNIRGVPNQALDHSQAGSCRPQEAVADGLQRSVEYGTCQSTGYRDGGEHRDRDEIDERRRQRHPVKVK